ncbi:MAG: TlpA disulfide reductase family protein [Candidatus Omnitrophota bacterium]
MDFELTDLKSGKFVLSSYKGKNPVLLFFWTTECPLCGYEMPVLNKMYPDLLKDGLVVASVNVGEDLGLVVDYMSAYPDALYPVLLDISYLVARKYRVFGVPTYILIDKDGYIVFVGHRFSQAKFKEVIP